MKIAFFEIENWEKDYLRKSLKNHKLLFFNTPLTIRNVKKIKDVDVLCVFIYSKIDKDILDKLPNLKLICTMSTGFDHIDMEACKKSKIKVKNVPYYGENTVAEHTFSLILALSRKIPESYEKIKKGRFDVKGLRGFDLKDKTLGVVGAGHIGLHVIRIAKGFEMNVLAYDVKKNQKLSRKLGFKFVSLDTLLKNSDIISLHVPSNKYTKHMINKKNIKLIKKGALLINTARGDIVETDALIKALKNKIIGGAGLDVLEEEYFIKEEAELLSKKFLEEHNLRTVLQNHVLLKLDNVLITPHNAFNSKEALLRIIDTTIENINSFKK